MKKEQNQKSLKNILIRTTKNYKDELVNLLGNIPHKIHKGDGKGKIYEHIVVKYGLFPFDEPNNFKDNNLKFVLDIQYLEDIKNIDGMVKSNGQMYSFRYKEDGLVKSLHHQIQTKVVLNKEILVWNILNKMVIRSFGC